MSFLGKANFCTNGHSQLQHLCHVLQSDMLSVYHSLTQLFLHVHFSLSSLRQLEWLATLQQSPVPLHFPLPDVVIATDATPTHWSFYFQGSGLPLSVSGAWSGSLSRAHILACRNFRLLPSCSIGWPSASLVRLLPCIWITVLLRCTCVIKVVWCLLFSRLACWILSLTDKHGITLLPAYIPTHLNVEAYFLSWDWMLLEWHLLPQMAQAAFHLWDLPEVDLLASSHSIQCQYYFTLETPLPLGALGVECLQPSLEI